MHTERKNNPCPKRRHGIHKKSTSANTFKQEQPSNELNFITTKM